MAQDVICSVCGAGNEAEAERCSSCGAKIELFESSLSEEEAWARRHQQDGFVWRWVFISAAVYAVLIAIALILLPKVIPTYDPQGLPGLLITAVIWFFGGALVALISPGKTFLEPTVGAIVATGPTMFWLEYTADVYKLSMLNYIAAAILGVMIALFGAFFGELMQRKRT